MTSLELLTYLNKLIKDFETEKINEQSRNGRLGVIYTPKLIVDHIVMNIFKFYFEKVFNLPNISNSNSSLKQIYKNISQHSYLKLQYIQKLKTIRILDPAFGSGRFLISIANFLYWIYKILSPELNNLQIKRSIVEKNLYGIEIERTAYIITKLRLFTWVFSGEAFPQILPNFNVNNRNLEEINEIITKLNLNFNLYNEDFLLEFESKKFDLIIGNPPYIENKKIKNREFKKALNKKFNSAYRLFDLSIVFIEKSLELLKEKEGYLSLIMINKFLSADYGVKIREMLVNNTELKEIINISSLPIFTKTAVYPIIITLRKSPPKKDNTVIIKTYENIDELNENGTGHSQILPQKLMKQVPAFVFPIFGKINIVNYLFSKFNSFKNVIKDLKIIYRPYGFLNWSKHLNKATENPNSDKDLLLIGTGNLGKYYIKFDKPIKLAKKTISISYFKYHNKFENIWETFKNPKLVFREIAKELTWIYDPGIYTNVTGLYFVIIPSFSQQNLFSLLAIMNSKLMDKIFKTLFSSLHMAGGYLRFNGSFIKRLPLPHRLPFSLSICGRYIQILTQLYYDFNSKYILKLKKLKLHKDKFQHRITKLLEFYLKLNNSLVNLLYLDDLYLEHNHDFNELREVLNSKKNRIQIQFKYLLPRFQVNKYDTYSFEELEATLDTVQNFSKILGENKVLMTQMDQILKNDLS